MIILDTVTRTLQAKLAGTVTANQLPIVACYVDLTSSAYTPGLSNTATNNTTAVTAVSNPSASTQRQVKFLSIRNADTASATVTLQLDDNGTTREIVKVTLAQNDTLLYTDGEGFRVIDSSGQIKQTGSGGGGSTSPGGSDTQVQFNDSGSFGGDAGFVYDKTTDTATLVNLILSGLTASRAVVTDGSKQLSSSAVTSTELGYVSGVTSAIQTQFSGKQARARTVSTKTGNYTITSGDDLIRCDASGGGFTITTPDPATVTGIPFTIKKVDSSDNQVTVSGTIDGQTQILAVQYAGITIISNGTNYDIV